MDYEDERELDQEVDDIINQIKNQGKSLKHVEKEKPDLKKEDLEKFVIENASSVILDSVEMIQTLKTDIMSGADPKLVEATSELVKATTAAMETLSKLKLSDDKIKGQKELKQMEIAARLETEQSTPTGGIYLSREEVIKNLFLRKETEKIEEKPVIDI